MNQDLDEIKTVLAIDYGAHRTGLAVGQTLSRRASSLKTLQHPWHRPDWRALDTICKRWQPGMIVVGYPMHDDSNSSSGAHIGHYIKRFCKGLSTRYRIEVVLFDESYTSAMAAAELRQQRRQGQLKRRVRKGDIDAGAACVLLDSWFNQSALPSMTNTE